MRKQLAFATWSYAPGYRDLTLVATDPATGQEYELRLAPMEVQSVIFACADVARQIGDGPRSTGRNAARRSSGRRSPPGAAAPPAPRRQCHEALAHHRPRRPPRDAARRPRPLRLLRRAARMAAMNADDPKDLSIPAGEARRASAERAAPRIALVLCIVAIGGALTLGALLRALGVGS